MTDRRRHLAGGGNNGHPCLPLEQRLFGKLGTVSAISLGGGGIGGVYGRVDAEEARATVRAAVEAGVSLLDLAPIYGPGERSPAAELLVAEALDRRIPQRVRVTTKVLLPDPTSSETSMRDVIRASLEGSLERLGRDRIDILFLHNYVSPSDVAPGGETIGIGVVRSVVRHEFERLREEGLVSEWGLTGIGHAQAICTLLQEEPKPAVVQCVTNAIDSVGHMWPFASSEHPDNTRIRATAIREGVAVMGIRALAAGALTDGLDRSLGANDPTTVDFERAAPFREFARSRGSSPASDALQYALSLPGVATVVIGAKTRAELAECLVSAAAERFPPDTMASIEAMR